MYGRHYPTVPAQARHPGTSYLTLHSALARGSMQTNATGHQSGKDCRMSLPARGLPAPCRTIVARSQAMSEVVRRLERYAAHDHVTILIEGESGVGKTAAARHVHACSPRSRAGLHSVDLGALDDGVASSALFGHVVGAFTDARYPRAGAFTTAQGGTLFLDEIGKASKSVQQKLLCAIENREVTPVGSDRPIRTDARLVIASNRALDSMVDTGEFLPDLHARLEAFRVRVPPLRERTADIPALAEDIVTRWAKLYGYVDEGPQVSSDLLECLMTYGWPNNLRELDGALQRILIEADGARSLTRAHWQEVRADSATRAGGSRPRVRREVSLEEIEVAITEAGSINGAAAKLGVPRTTLIRQRANHLQEGRRA